MGTYSRDLRRGNSHTLQHIPGAFSICYGGPQPFFQLCFICKNLNPRDRNGDPGGIACMQAQTMHCTRIMLVASKGRCVLIRDDGSRLNQPAILMWQTDVKLLHGGIGI